MRLAMFQPDIAGNVGTAWRLCACLGIACDVIEPCGFPLGDRALRRAAMDYAGAAGVSRHADWAAFRAATQGRLVLLSTRGTELLPDFAFRPDDVLLLGSESAGVPDEVRAACAASVRIPMTGGMRSLNMAVAAALALAVALDRVSAWPERRPAGEG